ncbi:MAG TPA: hypothetical protein PK056_01665 [Methylotenera sp.]|nr:hypothetical protein [Methylotenera sp.]
MTTIHDAYINALLADGTYALARVGRNSLRIAPHEKCYFRRIKFH